jgi:dienelactone hydrolase
MKRERNSGIWAAEYGVRLLRKRAGSMQRRLQSRWLRLPIEISERAAAEQLAAVSAEISGASGWRLHASRVRAHVLHAAGLAPMPVRADLRVVWGRHRELGSYSVDNVAFESFPGFFVTGNLYRPIGHVPKSADATGQRAAVLAPHGHTSRKRGAYRGRFTVEVQTLCASLARMGGVAFAYDMVGWGESRQSRHRKQGSVLGLQLWDSIRAVDFLASLPDVAPHRIGMAGFSGGATQALLAAAVDERIAAVALVAQLSAHFYGGCSCERGAGVADSTFEAVNNVEIAAAAAPRPQLLVSTGWDWSRNTPEVEYPFLARAYDARGAGSRVEHVHLPAEDHDFGPAKRAAVYRFLAARLGLPIDRLIGEDGCIDDGGAAICTREALCVFDEKTPRPSSALAGGAAVRAAFAALPRNASP